MGTYVNIATAHMVSVTSPAPTDKEYVALAKAGETEAFEALFRTHRGRIYALCLRMVRDETEAEDLTQEAFVRAWKKLGTFRGESAFSTWLHRLTVNLVLTNRRSHSRRIARVSTTDDLTPFDKKGRVTRPDLSMDLEHAIAQLPPGARKVFILHDVEGYRHREIAEMMGLATGTTKAQLHRARKLLRKVLS